MKKLLALLVVGGLLGLTTGCPSPTTKPSTQAKPGEESKKPAEKKPETTAKITGKVTYQAKPLTGGLITFLGKTGTISGLIAEDGTYVVAGVKPGTYKVAIAAPVANPAPQGKQPGGKAPADLKADAKRIPIPAKYGNPDTSGLTYTVKEGNQTYDIDLQ